MIEFRVFNLMSAQWAMGEPFDIVFCRNVLLYFRPDAAQRVLARGADGGMIG